MISDFPRETCLLIIWPCSTAIASRRCEARTKIPFSHTDTAMPDLPPQFPSAVPEEEGVEIPYERINPDTLRNMVEEFVTRDGADWGESGCTLEDKVEQVLRQLKNKKAKIVLDLKSQTANIIGADR